MKYLMVSFDKVECTIVDFVSMPGKFSGTGQRHRYFNKNPDPSQNCEGKGMGMKRTQRTLHYHNNQKGTHGGRQRSSAPST